MIKIGYPQNFDRIKPYFPEKEKEKDLYIMAEDTETHELMGIVRFFYDASTLSIYEIQMPYRGEQYLSIFDGIIRTLLFKLAGDEYQKVSVKAGEQAFNQYFLNHKFRLVDDQLIHDNFPAEFFKPCEGCREQ